MDITEEQIKDFLGAFRILFSEEEIKDIKESKDKEFVKKIVDKIDKFLAQTFKEIKAEKRNMSIVIYYAIDMKKLSKVKKIKLNKEDYEILNNPKFQDNHKKILDKYLELLGENEKKKGYYIGVFEDGEGAKVKSAAGVVN